jgi:hypothetical protein
MKRSDTAKFDMREAIRTVVEAARSAGVQRCVSIPVLPEAWRGRDLDDAEELSSDLDRLIQPGGAATVRTLPTTYPTTRPFGIAAGTSTDAMMLLSLRV